MDILSEDAADGTRRTITFHRFVWTPVLGTVFASNVISELVMPTFDSSLSVLMGISSGTCLGFKLPAGARQ
jgi:hypothetical protein